MFACVTFYDHVIYVVVLFFFFFFNDTATTEIYTLSLHDALPIYIVGPLCTPLDTLARGIVLPHAEIGDLVGIFQSGARSEEHTSELQSPCNLVCRLLLEKKNKARSPTGLNTTSTHSSALWLRPVA